VRNPMSILNHIRLHEENKFNNVDKPDEKVCELNDIIDIETN